MKSKKLLILVLSLWIAFVGCQSQKLNDVNKIDEFVIDPEIHSYSYIKEYWTNSDNISEETNYCTIFYINDENVKEDTILVDFYSIDENGRVIFYNSKDGESNKTFVENSTKNYELQKDGEYVFGTYEPNNDVLDYQFNVDNLEYGKHYVVTFAKIKYITDIYK